MSDNSIKDGVYGYVSGTVGKTGQYAKGTWGEIEVKREGSQYPDRVTVWGLEAATGDRVTVKGFLSWRKTEKDGKTYLNVSLNKPTVEKHERAQQGGYPSAPAGSDDWDQPTLGAETPF